ncbi:hypothetical protein LUZ60_006375 [Juncus effusus]|nr:hypothetical protein LUZ60_006375 [Juncus effusus]
MPPTSCPSCGPASTIITDPDTNALICLSCGAEVGPSSLFINQIPLTCSGGIDQTAVSYVSSFTYLDRKIRGATAFLKALADRLGLSALRAEEALQLARDATDGSLALEGTLFLKDLSASCVYIVARRHNLPLSISEVASSVGSDPHDLSLLIKRISLTLSLPPLPSFDSGAALERFVKSSSLLKSSSKTGEIIGQGRFLLYCSTKWSLSTGRHPLPVIAAVLAIVVQGLGFKEVGVDEMAGELGVVVSTSRVRYRELVGVLVRVARVLLPWGKDVEEGNLVGNLPVLIRLMELKAKGREDEGFLEGFRVGRLLEGIEGGLKVGGRGKEGEYFRNEKKGLGFSDGVKISGEGVLRVSESVGERVKRLKNGGKRKRGFNGGGFEEEEGFGLRLDLDEKRWKCMKGLSVDEVLSLDVGFDALPPSFVRGVELRELRRERIEKAKCRIEKVRTGCDDLKEGEKKREKKRARKRKGGVDDCMDWEDCIIELLLLHGVNEGEIEEGQYRRLLDLHVYGS